MNAAIVVDNLLNSDLDSMCANGAQTDCDDEMCTNGSQILPTSERQVRPLTKLEPDQQREAWALAVERAGGKVPRGATQKCRIDLKSGKATGDRGFGKSSCGR